MAEKKQTKSTVPTNGKRALELLDLMKSSPGQRVLNEKEMLGWTTHTFQKNVSHLRKFVDRASTDQSLIYLRNRDLLEDAQKEIGRLLHNAVAAATTLVDHSRIVSRRLYAGHPERQAEYQRRVDALFTTNPLIQFVQGLRDYCLHYGLPFVGWSMHFHGENELRQSFFLNKALLERFEWKSVAKGFLSKAHKHIDFVETIENYHEAIGDFYRWFESDIIALYSKELDELQEYRAEYHLIHLESDLRTWDSNDHGSTDEARIENLFCNLLSSRHLDQMNKLDGPKERIEFAISILDPILSIPEDMKKQLRSLF